MPAKGESQRIPTVPDINQSEKPVRKMTMQEYYRTEEKVSVMLSPMYQNHFGKVMPIMINGITIAVPVDGKTYAIPATFAAEVHRRRMAVDAEVERAERLADIQNNGEQYPGALKLT